MRRPHRYLRLSSFLILAATIAAGCADDGTPTDPGQTIPQIAGRYRLSEQLPAAACTPNALPPGGIVVVSAFLLEYDVRIEQTGSTLKLTEIDFPTDVETGTIDPSGKISFGIRVLFEETPREGNRIFFVDLTIGRDLQFQQSTSTIVGTSSAVNIFREGSATAPVYTTCSRHGGVTNFVRIGS